MHSATSDLLLSTVLLLGCGSGPSVGMDGLIGTSSRGHVVVGTEVDEQEPVAGSVGANKPGLIFDGKHVVPLSGLSAYIGLGPGDRRRTPLNSVAAEHERAARRGGAAHVGCHRR